MPQLDTTLFAPLLQALLMLTALLLPITSELLLLAVLGFRSRRRLSPKAASTPAGVEVLPYGSAQRSKYNPLDWWNLLKEDLVVVAQLLQKRSVYHPTYWWRHLRAALQAAFPLLVEGTLPPKERHHAWGGYRHLRRYLLGLEAYYDGWLDGCARGLGIGRTVAPPGSEGRAQHKALLLELLQHHRVTGTQYYQGAGVHYDEEYHRGLKDGLVFGYDEGFREKLESRGRGI
jgi:hypothetical protein